ncbi:hypothetical protein CEXT_77811 [Caerostris extrusa]|uniref:Uncharacterized protein n=1 Tax=Caerostris extrusa TaxID=172846 RepID=A0AAV4U5K0_CAEEX|nr:hypothetical protein CEXT_77811 [Caerostris extrusa]
MRQYFRVNRLYLFFHEDTTALLSKRPLSSGTKRCVYLSGCGRGGSLCLPRRMKGIPQTIKTRIPRICVKRDSLCPPCNKGTRESPSSGKRQINGKGSLFQAFWEGKGP